MCLSSLADVYDVNMKSHILLYTLEVCIATAVREVESIF